MFIQLNQMGVSIQDVWQKDGIFGKCGGALFGGGVLAVKISEQISLNLIEVKN